LSRRHEFREDVVARERDLSHSADHSK
jgi:hypothetical protein